MLETHSIEDWDKRCIVCHSATDHGDAVCRIKVIDVMTALCCPLCIETFNKDPKRYLVLRQLHLENAAKQNDTAHLSQ